MTLRDLAPVRVLAEERAERLQTIYRRNDPARRTIASGLAERSAIAVEIVEAHLDILCNLRDNPDSRDAVARLVAERVGLTCGATAPALLRIKGMDPSTIWSLSVRSDIDMDRSPTVTVDQRGFTEPGAFPDSPIVTFIPGISAITDPAEALTRIALAVLA